MKRVGIIGGGLGGLASACVLAARGYEVILFERNDWLGGKAAVLESQGFRFDMGPTILTLPGVLDRIFREAGRDSAEHAQVSSGSIRSGARSLTTARRWTWLRTPLRWREKLAAFSPKTKTADGYRRFMASPKGSTASPTTTSFGDPSAGCATCSMRARLSARRPRRCAGDAAGPQCRRGRSQPHPRFARLPDGRSFHAVCGLCAGRIARRALRHRAHADRRGRLVSDGWHPRHSGSPRNARRIAGRRVSPQRARGKNRHSQRKDSRPLAGKWRRRSTSMQSFQTATR